MLPSFFTLAISQALIPIVSKNYSNGRKEYTKKKIKQAILFSLVIGIPSTILFITIPDIFLKLVYNTPEGINYIRFMAPIFLLHYIQTPLSSSLQAMGRAKDSMCGTIMGVSIKLITVVIFCNLKIGLWGLILSTSINVIVVTIYDFLKVKSALN